MPNLYGIGVSGLRAAEVALDTTMHNITNASTDGYSRQRVLFAAQIPELTGVGYIGTGVTVENIERISSDFVNQALTSAYTSSSQADTYYDIASQVDNLLSDPSIGIVPTLNSFFSALETAQNNPASIPARQVVVSQMQILSSRINDLDASIKAQADTINNGIQTTVVQINALGASIATLNSNIVASLGATGGLNAPNDLLDQRDEAINQLAQCANISTLSQDDGSISVFLGNNQVFVMEGTNFPIGSEPNLNDSTLLDITYGTQIGSPVITNTLTGGALGGYYAVREQMVDLAQNSLDRLTLGLSQFFNTQNSLGIDLNGNIGENIFSDINSAQSLSARAAALSTNLGNGALTLTVTDVSQLGLDDFTLSYDGANYQLIDTTTNLLVQQTTSLAAITGLGFSLNLASGTMRAGDMYSIRPMLGAATNIASQITDPNTLAFASPIRLMNNINNTGDAALGNLVIQNTSGLPIPGTYIYGNAFSTPHALTPPIEIRFTSATTFQIFDMTTAPGVQIGPDQTYVSGASIFPLANVVDATPPGPNPNYTWDPGYQVSLTGVPATGDIFDLTYNTDAATDNQNAVEMVSIRNQKNMQNGTASLIDTYGQLVGSIGSLTESANISMVANDGLLARIQEQQESISGVSLDEEAANLIQYQQAYQAAAQLLAIARETFNDLLATLGAA